MSLIVDDSDVFDFNLVTPTPRASTFPPIQIPPRLYCSDALSPYTSPELSTSPYSSPSPQSSANTSLSPTSIHMDLPQDVEDYTGHLNFAAPLSRSPKSPARSRPQPPRKGDPSYIPRPENAFILFRKDAVAKMRAAEAAANAEADSLSSCSPKEKGDKGRRQRQADMSKSISTMWRNLSKEQRKKWDEQAANAKREHEAKHPDYRYQPSRPTKETPSSKRSSPSKSPSKSRIIRRRAGLDLDDDDSSYNSEDLSIVVRPQRAPRRGSTCSTASSASSYTHTSPISLPRLHGGSRSASPYPLPSYVRSSRSVSSRQWVLPPNEDPSPPPSELHFPRGNVRSGLDIYNGGLMELEPSPLSDTSLRRHDEITQTDHRPRRPSRDEGPVFVEPMTMDHNPWSPGGSKNPSTPKRARASTRPRSFSQPHPLQFTQSAPVDIREPSFQSPSLPWSPSVETTHRSPVSESGYYRESFGMPWTPINESHSPSSPDSDCVTDFGAFDLTSEDWMHMLEPHSDALNMTFDDPSSVFGFQFDSSQEDEENHKPYTVVNLDEEGRQRAFF